MESNQKMKKFEIDIEIKDLLWEFVKGWRIVAIMAFLCGCLLTIYQYRIDMNKTDTVTVRKTQEQLEQEMAKQDLDEVTAAVALKRQMDEKSEYMEESILMQINPYEENAVVLQYYIDAETDDVARNAKAAYITYISNHLLAESIADSNEYDIKSEYLAELISVVSDTNNIFINDESATESILIKTDDTKDGTCFCIKVIGRTEEEAENIASSVKRALSDYNNLITDSVGMHYLQLLEESLNVVIDQNLAELQNWNATSIKKIGNNIDSMKNEMIGEQITLYTYRVTNVLQEEVTGNAQSANTNSVSISIKHLVIGVIVGTILGCGVVFLLFLFSNSLRSHEEVQTLYGVNVLGSIDVDSLKSKKLLQFVDRGIKKIRYRKKRILNMEQEIQRVCSNILVDSKKNGYDEVFVSSSVDVIPQEIKKAIVELCEKKGIHLVWGNSINYDSDAIEALAKIGRVIFIEQERVSLYDDMYDEIALCKTLKLDVVGMVVLK